MIIISFKCMLSVVLAKMNIKLLSINEENENFEYTSWRHNMFEGLKKRGGTAIRESSQFGELLYINLTYLC